MAKKKTAPKRKKPVKKTASVSKEGEVVLSIDFPMTIRTDYGSLKLAKEGVQVRGYRGKSWSGVISWDQLTSTVILLDQLRNGAMRAVPNRK